MKSIAAILQLIIFALPVSIANANVSINFANGGRGQVGSTGELQTIVNTSTHTTLPEFGVAVAAGADIQCDYGSALIKWDGPKHQEYFKFDVNAAWSRFNNPTGWTNVPANGTMTCSMFHKTIARTAFGGTYSGQGFSITWASEDMASNTETIYMNKECTGEGGPEGCDDSPIVFDMDRNGFQFTGLEIDPVLFDIDNDGMLERTAWTDAASRDAFIALDRNGNGIIDNGGELFGNATIFQNGITAPNGYEALAELDTPLLEGNGDDILDKRDALFRNLVLWVDANHDGYSDEEELWPFRKEVNAQVNLEYLYGPEFDEFGNQLKYFSNALFKNRGRDYVVDTTDVFFQTTAY